MNLCMLIAIILAISDPAGAGTYITASGIQNCTPRVLEEYNYISIVKYYFNPRQGTPDIPVDLKGASDHYLVHLKGPVYESMKLTLEAYGVQLIEYIPFNAYLVKMSPYARTLVERLPFVNWVGNYEPAYKLSPLFDENPVEKRMLVVLFYDTDINQAADELSAIGCDIMEVSENEYNKIVKVSVDRAQLAAIARLTAVKYLEPWFDPVAYNNSAQWVTQTWQQQSRRLWSKGIQGRGQVVNTCDTGILTTHDMFRDPAVSITTWGDFTAHRKIIAYRTWTGSSAAFGDNASGTWHGTHTAGTICGDDSYVSAISDKDGMPPKAKMYFMDIGTSAGSLSIPADLINLFTLPCTGNAAGAARVSSNSWGTTGTNGDYTTNCSNTDRFMWNNEQFLICFSAGNSGPGTNTVTSPGTAKNIITAGAVMNSTASVTMADFSSRGPCDDTRIKPTVTAPGYFLYSSAGAANNTYIGMAGTSMSSPCIAGNTAMIREYFARGFYPTGDSTPANQWTYISAALVKAMIVNGAHPSISGSVIPDNNTGWGRVCLDDVIYFSNDIKKLSVVDDTHGVATGEYQQYVVTVNNQSEPLKITVVWTDYWGASGANPAIVNNLDLLVTGPNAVTYHGNQYTSGESTPNASGWDNRNVEENARRNVPETGTWTIRITGTNVPSGTRQAFALVVSGGLGAVSAPALHIAGSQVQDPSPANQNARVDAGETVYFTDTLKNLSALGVTGCTGTLRETSSYITLLDSVGSFGDIAIGATGHNGASRFRFTASPSTPAGTFVPFTLHLTGGGGYVQDIPFDIMIGISEVVIIWGPKNAQLAPTDTHFLYGAAYNYANDQLYVTNAYETKIYRYSSDSNVTYLGYITAPDTFGSDIKYCGYDNTFWLAADWAQAYPDGKRVFKISTSGTVLRQFASPANDYPTGLAWLEPQRLLYLADRRTAQNTFPQYIYRSDTLGTGTQLPIVMQGNVGPRGLAIDPYGPDTTLLHVYTWFNTAGTALDSVVLYELRRSDLAVLNRVQLPGWNVRGVEYDPRDGNYWLTIAQNPQHSIVKILGFHGRPINVGELGSDIPGEFVLFQNVPNPFTSHARISYSLPVKSRVQLKLYDVSGRLVTTLVDRTEEPGLKTITWNGKTTDGSTVASGVYFYQLDTDQNSLVRKLVFTR